MFTRSLLVLLILPCLLRAENLGNYAFHTVSAERLVVHTSGAALSVTPYSDTICRVALHPDGLYSEDSSVVVCLPPQSFPWQVTVQDSALLLSTAGYTVRIQKYPLRLRLESQGQTVLEDAAGFFWNGAAPGVQFRLAGDEHLWGTGERAVGLDQRGRRLDFYNAPRYCYGSGEQNMNIGIPFVLSSKHCGVYFDDPWPATLDLGHTAADVLEYGATGGKLAYFAIVSGTYAGILNSYTTLTGRPSLPPRWALGYLQSRYGYQNDAEARAVVRAFRERGIPLDALILDLYWFGLGQMGDFDWDAGRWPNPSQMIHDFELEGVKTLLITEPYFVTTSSHFNFASSMDYLTPDSSGATVVMPEFWFGAAGLLDITNPNAADWFWSLYQPRIEEGVAGWWCDLGEPELHPARMVHAGGSAAQIHNTYSLLWARLLDARYRQHYPQRRLFNLIRSGYAGMQRFGCVPWSGDVQRAFSGLDAQLPILLNMGLSGVPFTGSDIGGFDCGPQNPELYIRWMQYGAFSPLMRAHGTGVPAEPVYYDSTTERVVRDYIRLRYSLLPYNYTLFAEAARSGLPPARPVFLEDHDPAAANLSDEYRWGGAFLVAPVLTEGARSRSVYFPSDLWIDYWSGTTHRAGVEIVDAPLEKIPLYIKAGSIIPMTAPLMTTREYRGDTLLLHYYADAGTGASEFAMYEDDGETRDAQTAGTYNTLRFSAMPVDAHLNFRLERTYSGYAGAPAERRILLALHRTASAPEEVRLADMRLPQMETLEALEQSDSGWYFAPNEPCLYVTLHWSGSDANVAVNGFQALGVKPLSTLPQDFSLEPAFPNPFNNVTRIAFSLPHAGTVSLKVYDVLGRRAATLADGAAGAGRHSVQFRAGQLSSGLYFFRLEFEGRTVTGKAVLLR